MKKGNEKDWQRNPESIKTPKVQCWLCSGIMLTAEMPKATAQELVKYGSAFVISEQAIGQFEP
jgi:hypothetical protein